VILCEKGSKLRVFVKFLIYSFLCDFRLKTLTVKKYYSAVYGAKVAFYAALHACFSLVSHAFASKNPCFWPIILFDIQINVNDVPCLMLLY
jgi:hypothetical protein